MNRFLLALVIAMLILFYSGCEPVNNNEDTQDNPAPTLTSISPTSKVQHLPTFTLTASGSNFVSSSQVIFDGTAMPTTYVSDSELTCQVGPGAILAATQLPGSNTAGSVGSPATTETVSVYVHNPSPGGGDSGELDFKINSDHSFYVSRIISGTTGDSSDPHIAVDHLGYIHVTWTEVVSNSMEVYYMRSTDGGSNWISSLNLSNSPGSADRPTFIKAEASPSTNVHLIWSSYASGVTKNILCTSNDSGATWSAPVELSSNAGLSGPIVITDNSGNLEAIWSENPGSDDDVFFCRCTDLNTGWSTPVNVSNNSGSSTIPAVAVSSAGTLFAAWNDDTGGKVQLQVSRSTDNGATWSIPSIIGDSADPKEIRIQPGSTNECYLFWKELDMSDPSCFETYFRSARSTDNGATWSDKTEIFSIGCHYTGDAFAVDSAGNVNAAISDYNNSSGHWEAYFFRSIDVFSSWSNPLKFSLSTIDACLIDMTVDNQGNVYIVWDDSEYNSAAEIYFTSSVQ